MDPRVTIPTGIVKSPPPPLTSKERARKRRNDRQAILETRRAERRDPKNKYMTALKREEHTERCNIGHQTNKERKAAKRKINKAKKSKYVYHWRRTGMKPKPWKERHVI